MTDYINTTPIKLTPAQLEQLIKDGEAAMTSIQGAGAGAPPVGVWQKMYHDIDTMMGSNQVSGWISDQEYWFSQAGFVNGDVEKVPSGYFVRDVTALGMGVSGPTNINVQKASDAVGEQIYLDILKNGTLPAFWQQLNADIYSAFNGYDALHIYSYPALPIGAWGGTFYYWNSPYSPTGSINETTPPPDPLSQYILGNSTQNQTFITNYSQAIANTVIHFQNSGIDPFQIVPSVLSALNGTVKIWNSGWGGKLDIVELIANTISDYQASGGGSVAALQNALVGFVQSQIGLYLGSGSTNIAAGGEGAVLVGGQGIGSAGNDTLTGGGGGDTFLVNLPTTGSVTETINDAPGLGQIVVSNAGQFDTLGGNAADPLTAVAGQQNTWQDSGGTQYVYGPSTDQLVISGGYLGSGNEVVVDNFNVGIAAGTNPYSGAAGGFVGIFLPQALNLTAGAANAAAGASAPNFIAGGAQSYTVSVDAPSTSSQTLTVTLVGASPSDFEAMVGNTVEQLSANGTFDVTLAAGETNVAFTLQDVTTHNGSSDIAGGATLQLNASLPNPDILVGGSIPAAALTFNYIPTPPDTGTAPQNLNPIAGTLTGGVTNYVGDGGNDFISAGTGPNYIDATNSIDDIIIGGAGSNTILGGSGNDVTSLTGSQDYVSLGNGFNTLNGGTGKDTIYSNNATAIINGNSGTDVIIAGDGTNEIYAGVKTSLANAIAAASTATATGQKGDLIAVGDGNNTIVGTNGNDFIASDDSFQNGTGGNDVIVLGAGNDTYFGGVNVTEATGDWTLTLNSNNVFIPTNMSISPVDYTNPYAQPYNGNYFATSTGSEIAPDGAGNVTIYGGTGNYTLSLSNGNNYVDVGSGNSSVYGGMGNDTIIAGSGTDIIHGGGGTTYIEGGSGVSTLVGGDGDNTIIGGSGNATIYASSGPNAFINFTNANLDNSYVDGGSGNDVIYGSAGNDTLIAGTGNTTIHGQFGNENIVGGSGNDFLTGGVGNNTIAAGGAGLDTLFAEGSSSSTSYLYGGSGVDYIVGGSGVNVINAGDGGTAGAATSVFASQSDATATSTIYGGNGVDFLEAGAGASVIYGGNGGTSAARTTLIGWTGADTLVGGLGTDVIYGGTGSSDVLYAGDGGTAAAPTTVVSGAGVDSLYGGAGSSLLQDVTSGRDLLVSGSANDTLIGTGSDTLVAGTGNDILQANGGTVDIQVNAGFGNDTVYPNGGTENLLLGSGILASDFSGAVTFDSGGNAYLSLSGDGGSIAVENGLTGALAGAQYVGGSSIPLLTLLTDALGGDQTVTAGSAHFIVNLANNESVNSINSGDVISSWGSGATINGGSLYNHVYSTGASTLINSAGYGVINATGNNDTVHGGSYGGDAITLSGGNSLASVGVYLNGNAPNFITASGTNDTVVSGSGSVASVITVNDASTVIQVATGAGATSVSTSVSYTAPTNVTNLTLIGTASIVATGNAGADVLTGGAGRDTLIAGAGVDTLIGGSGNTTFVVNNTGDIVQDNSTTANNTVQSAVSFVLPTNVNNLILTGTSALTGTANGGNDTLISNTGVDTLYGGTGNDTFILNNAADVVIDTAGTATIVYASSVDFTLPANVNTLTLLGTAALMATGNAGNDSIAANAGADTLIAGNGNDTLVSGTGTAVDSLVGGTGNDLFVVNYAGDLVTVGSTHGNDTIQSSVSYTASNNVANLTLTGTDNIVATGNALANVLTANVGNDTLVAGSGLATLIGGTGNDTFVLNNAGDVVQDSSTTSSNTILASFNYTLPTLANNLVLTGTGALTGTANSGNDTLASNSGLDTLIGGSGNDTFIINNSDDVVQDTSTTAGNVALSSVNYTLPVDVNVLTLTGTAALMATGNAGNDVLIANAGADTLVAGNGSDTLVSATSAQAESLVGGTGSDLFIVNNGADVITIGGTHGADSIQSSVSYTLPTAVNTLTLLGSANLTGTALSGANVIIGNAGNDVLQAGSGNDTLTAGSGVDTLIGGAGSDTFVVNSALDVLQSISAAGNFLVSSVGYTLPTNVTTLTLTGTANLNATGNAQANVIKANAGNDTLTAGAGVATFYSGDGNDLFVVNSASDQVVADNDGFKYGRDTVQSSVSYSLGAAVNTLVLTGSANVAGTGNSYGATYSGDLIVGNAGLDTLTAGLGTDTLVAGAGLATLVGAVGIDTFIINNVGDVIQDSVTGYNNVLVSSVNYTLPTNVNTLALTGSANLTAAGNSVNDSMVGNAGADSLIAGAGNDTLVSGSGIDTLVGGAGADIFVINNTADVVQSASTSSGNALFTSTSYVLPTNVNTLKLTGVANISGTGNASADTLTGGAGNDTLIAGSGLATLIGGLGNTTFVVNSANDVVTETSTATSNSIQSSVNFTLVTNVNSLILTGTAALVGTANSANDTLISNSGVDTLVGGNGNETFLVNNSGDVLQDTSTTATNVALASVNYSLAANVNTLVLTGTAALVGTANAANDTLTSNSAADTLIGGVGNDTFIVNNSLDVVQDTATGAANLVQASVSYTLPTNVNALTLTGTAALAATGNAAADIITANSGNDTLAAGSGAATLIGGTGNDTFVVNSATDVVQDASTTATNTLQSSISTTLMANVNTLVLTGTGMLTGTANGANDTLVSNSGIDTLVGGAGNDIFVVNNSADVILNATANDTIESSVNFTLPTGINNLLLIGSGNISGTGNSGADVLTAGAGIDTLIAGAGVATLNGGTGNDTFVVNSTLDVVQDSLTTTANNIVSSVSYSLPTNVDALTLSGTANLTATGNSDAANVLTANSGNDLLIGTAFSNTINGGVGSDTIDAGPEANVIYAGNGGTTSQPTIVYGNASGTNATTQSTIYGGSGSDVIYGGPGTDLIYGGTGTNVIYGGSGSDVMMAGAGPETLFAGTGADSIYGAAGDVLMDHQSGISVLVAGSGAETLSGKGNDTLMAGTGGDFLYDSIVGTGSTVYAFGPGFGQDSIGDGVAFNGTTSNASIFFESGISQSALSVGQAVNGNDFSATNIALVINDGTSAIVINGGLSPGAVNSVTIGGTSESLAQFLNSFTPTASSIQYNGPNGLSLLSIGSGQTISDGYGKDEFIWAFGNNDQITVLGSNIFAYGNNDTIVGGASSIWVGGNNNAVTLSGNAGATLVGSVDTVVAGNLGSNFVVQQASDVIQVAGGMGTDTVDAFVSYTLPTNVQTMLLDSSVGSLSGTSNSQGGVLIAAGSADTLIGGAGQDTLNAGGNNDVLIGGAGSEAYVLKNATDTIVFGSGAASLNSIQAALSYTLPTQANTLTVTSNYAVGTGNAANDSLIASGSYDTVVAGSGNDTLVYSGITQTALVGGSGNDTFVVSNASDSIQDTSSTTNNTVLASVSFSLPTNVNSLTLTGNNNLSGTANTGNDSITGNAGNDTIIAGTGNDTLVAGGGVDVFTLNAGFGYDQIVNANNGDVIQFGSGITLSSLTFTALPGSNGAAPSLVIAGAGGSVTVQGGLVPGAIGSVKFSDGSSYSVGQLVAPSGHATITGSSGNLILGYVNGDSLTGGISNDTIIAYGNNDTINAGSGGAVIYSAGSNDSITGGAATDWLEASGANTTLLGGAGNETFAVDNATTLIQVSAGVGHDSVLSSVSYTIPNNVSVLTLVGTAALTATGNGGNDTITGNAGHDILIAGSGIDTLIGNSMADTFDINNASDSVQALAGNNDTIVSTAPLYTLPSNVNNLQVSGYTGVGNSNNDVLSGSYGTIYTGNGNDTVYVYESHVYAGSGNDWLSSSGFSNLNSGTGIDTLQSTYEYDQLAINNSADVITSIGSYDTLYTSVNYTLAANVGVGGGALSWNLLGTAALVATSNARANVTITANSGNDTLVGGPYGVTFSGDPSGTNQLTEIGGPAANTFFVANASDILEAPTGAYNIIDSYISYTLPTNINGLHEYAASTTGVGNNNNDDLEAWNSMVTLVAGSGADSLISVYGYSTLVAGTGNDTFSGAYAGRSGDVFLFNPGFGTDVATGGSSSVGPTIEFGSGINPSSLAVVAALGSGGGATLKIVDGSSSILLDQTYGPAADTFSFAGGPSLSLSQFLADVTVTSGTLTGSYGNFILEATPSATVSGGTGSDTIWAAGAHDTLIAGSGYQSLVAFSSYDSLVGGTGGGVLTAAGAQDSLVAGAGAISMVGSSAGTDTFVVNSTSDTVVGATSTLNDTLESSISFTLPSSVGTIVLSGTAALVATASYDNDTLVAGAPSDTLVGGSGNDTFIVNSSAVTIQDSFSTSTNTVDSSVNYVLPTNVNNLVLTGTGALSGTANSATDSLISNSGVDTLMGGSGNDTFVINNAGDVVQDTSTTAANSIDAYVSYTLPTNVNNLFLQGAGNLMGSGNGANDFLVGNAGLDTLIAGNGTDTLIAGTGLATLIGGSGNDLFVVDNTNDVVQDTSTTAANSVQSSANFTLVTNVNSLTLTGTVGLSGAANGGTDTLTSNTGVDTLVGGSGNDTFVINNSGDVIQDTSTTATNIAKSAVSYSLAANVNTLTLTGSARLVGTANGGNDSITGNSGADTLVGGSGVDTLVAGTGITTLVGGSGNTTFVINNASDVVLDTYTTSTNTLRSSVTYILPTDVNALILTGTAALKGTANAGNDTLTSNTGVDTLVGGAGNDTFVVNNASDVVQDTSTTASNSIQTTVNFSLPVNVNTLTFTGSKALHGTGNAGNDSMTANTGADTLSAGNGTDTLVSSATGTAIDSLVGGTGNDLFIVNYSGDIVNVGATHGADTIQSSVNYTDAANVANLVLTGTGALTGTGSATTASRITANGGADTLSAGTAVVTLIGGAGNDTFVINSTSDIVQDTTTTTSNVLSSSVSYTLPTNVNRLVLTGTGALVGTANSANDTLSANTGADMLVSGTGVDSLVGGTGANLFIVNNASDIVNVGASHGVDTIQSSVSFTASANVANLTLTGTAALLGTGNSLAGTITANTGNDTLTAGSGADTLIGGTGTDVFVVNSASDIVSLATGGTSDTIQSSAATYTLPTNVQYLMLAGTGALAGTGNTLLDLITGNTGNDTLTGGAGIAALEGGKTGGSDQIKATGNQAALIAGGGSSTLTGGTYKDFYAAGKVSDTITTGATANVVSVNKGDGLTTLAPSTSATNVLSLGAGIDTESLFFTKTGNNLILTDGVSGDSITFTNWYVGSADQNVTNLQVVEIASANYNSGGGDTLRNKALEDFNFTSLVAAYNAAGSPANWALSTAMLSAQLSSSATADYGGDLAYYFGLNGNLTGVDLSAVQSTLTNASFGTAAQTIDTFSSISGGGGLHLLAVKPGAPGIQPITQPQASTSAVTSTSSSSTEEVGDLYSSHIWRRGHLPEWRDGTVLPETAPLSITSRRGIEVPRSEAFRVGSFTPVTAADAARVLTGPRTRETIEPVVSRSTSAPQVKSYVDPVNVAWLRMHGALDEINEVRMGGAEATAAHEEIATDALLGSAPLDRIRRTIGGPELNSPLERRRAM
jgi:Ca2+-binding RTX toxin-like protein